MTDLQGQGEGISRRAMLNRSAAALGIALAGNLEGLFGDLSVATAPGTTYRVAWVDVPDRDAATISTRKQFTNDQVTRSRKLESMWRGDGGRTSPPRSRASPTAAPRSTTGRCGSSTRSTTPPGYTFAIQGSWRRQP